MDAEDGGSTIMFSGSIFGDKFPSNETFITDQNGVGVFLGVSGADGNPFTSLPLDNSKVMSRFTLGVNFDSKGNITGVNANGTSFTVEEWNKRFSNLNPQDGNVSTKF